MLPIFVFICLTAQIFAAPTLYDDVYNYSNDLSEFLGRVSKHIEHSKDLLSSATCDASRIELPAYASGLPSPSDQRLLYVALGRGTQNYTCATSSTNSTPVAVGAVANLYNATCLAGSFSDMLNMLPNIAYKIPLPGSESDRLPPANLDLMGHHFFDGPTPVFNLDTTAAHQYGIARTKKEAQIDAPPSAIQGNNGAVAWLYLSTTSGTVGDYTGVYRVDTAAGSPPKTCNGMPSQFTVQYAANYYFYGK
ncbi:hypothetical protein ETB97_007805 [Aspergillus alliaceus]|uniref:Malate dehydrogenase n=1 Tax=Petromyces alliaceus TaxID=209559 RepID=A0A5N7BWK1_PETAA|nr:uncharacterized protein BDW43DRAFT_307563 [Aspergillus alliaceus]KAB8237290.1 hypothetical protein BDW43DRAFT_307563 [Aspergillus alliaceus]KAE8386210.1 hypothetical protein BDV23DRAFT_175631 [Aspergillus alliaceus]KAF5856172.1 hypothetical protein ETB97_007805 [Aspergillus burnettii]